MEHLPLYRRYLRSDRIRAGRRHARTRVLRIPVSSIGLFLRTIQHETPGGAWLVADENTIQAAPEVLEAIEPENASILPGTPRLIPEIDAARQIASRASACGAGVMLSVGGGTITDLAKYAALECDVPLIAVPTAASVDAYTSTKSALRIGGYHRTPAARTPDLVIACPEVLESQPTDLGLAGVGDLIAKLIARIDWQVGHLVAGETFDEATSWWSAQAARTALARFRRSGLVASSMTALDALLVTGRAMMIAHSSRPAASAEHTMAHLWEVAGGEEHLHGALVARGTVITVQAYRWIVRRLAERRDARPIHPILHAEQTWRDRIPDAMTPYRSKMDEESEGRVLDEKVLRMRRDRIARCRPRAARIADALLDEAERALASLQETGVAGAIPEISSEWQSLAVRWVKYLRNRYSLFDLAFEMGWEPELYEALGV